MPKSMSRRAAMYAKPMKEMKETKKHEMKEKKKPPMKGKKC